MKSPTAIAKKRPTETGTGFGGALALLIVYFLGVDDPAVYLALGIVISALPSAITWLVELVRSS